MNLLFELIDESHIIFCKKSDIVDSVLKHCNSFYTHTYSKTGILFCIDSACTVNMLDTVSRGWNLAAHFGMYACYEIYVALLFWYWMSVTVGLPKKKWKRALAVLCNLAIVAATGLLIGRTEFLRGEVSNYSMGPAVYLCFFSVYAHCIATVALIVVKNR